MPHYYNRDTGQLLPMVELKVRPGEYREPDLRDARKVNALVSVTTLISILAKPGLYPWQMEQVAKAAWDAPIHEDYAEWFSNVKRQAQEYTRYTQDNGNAIHYWIAKKLRAVETIEIPPLLAGTEEVADALVEWFPANGYEWEYVEHTFLRPDLGIASTADLVGTHWGKPCIGDTKSQNQPLTPYDPEHPLQLAGYSKGLNLPDDVERVSFIVDRDAPGVVLANLWKDRDKTIAETNARYNRMFEYLTEFWFLSNKYDPREPK